LFERAIFNVEVAMNDRMKFENHLLFGCDLTGQLKLKALKLIKGLF